MCDGSKSQVIEKGADGAVYRRGAAALARQCMIAFSVFLLAPAPVVAQKASHYSDKFEGRRTASGERYDNDKLTAASPNLPLGSKVKVTNKKTGQSVHVTVNDRSRRMKGRELDLSKAAAKQVGMTKDGTAPVRIERVTR